MASSPFLPGDKASFWKVQENNVNLIWLTLSSKPYLTSLENCSSLSFDPVFFFHLTKWKAMHTEQFCLDGGICVLKLLLITYAKSSKQDPISRTVKYTVELCNICQMPRDPLLNLGSPEHLLDIPFYCSKHSLPLTFVQIKGSFVLPLLGILELVCGKH